MSTLDIRSCDALNPQHRSQPPGRTCARIRTMLVCRQYTDLPTLQSILAEIHTIELVAFADSTASALSCLLRSRPELIVLDSRMPVEMALEILGKVRDPGRVIFASILCGVGFRAFDVRNHGSLLGSYSRVRETVDSSAQQIAEGTTEARVDKLAIDDPIILRLNDKYHVVRVRSILMVSSARHYSFVATVEGNKGISSRSMKDWEDRLPGNTFVRIHRNAIVNLDYIEHIEESPLSTYEIKLRGLDKAVPVSNSCFARMKKLLN